MKKEDCIKLAAFLLSINSLFTSCVYSNKSEEKDTVKEYIEEINNQDKYEFNFDVDTSDIEYEISKLGIVEDSYNPYNTYKVLRYIDNNQLERVCITTIYVKYNLDEDGNIINNQYVLYDAFSRNEIVILNHNGDRNTFQMDIKNIDINNNVSYIMSIGNLNLLKRIAIDNGMSEGYVNSVFNDDISNKSISVSEVARIYVSLVNSFYRANFNDNYNLTLK